MTEFPAKSRTNWARIKTVFVSEILRETAQRIRTDQNRVVDEWDLFESGTLKRSLQGHFSINAVEGGGKLHLSYLTYFRFLDMPDVRRKSRRLKKDGYHNYNKILFGNIYNYTVPEVMYGLTKEVHENIAAQLTEAFTEGKSKYELTEQRLTEISELDRNMAALLAKRSRRGYGF